MRNKILSMLMLSALLCSSMAFAKNNCSRELEARHLKRVSGRAKRIAGSVFVGALAVSPLVTPFGAILYGSIAVTLTGQSIIANELNRKGKFLPREVRQRIILDQVENPGRSLFIEHYTTEVLFGREVGYNYEVIASTKEKLLNAFTAQLAKKDKSLINLTNEQVSTAIYNLLNDQNHSLCKNKNGKNKTLSMRTFKKVIIQELKK
jgi:hypothetical protein